jgi:uncharacterized delta-60 repeat protein
MKNILSLLSIFTLVNVTNAYCQSAALDTTFNPGTGVNNSLSTAILQSDGKILIGGFFEDYNGIQQNNIARINTDGSLDTTFNSGVGADNIVSTLSVQSDGKIIVGGWFTHYNLYPVNRIARLNTDGTLDTTFNPGTGPDAGVLSTAIQNDGKILIGGRFTGKVERLNTDGSVDASFLTGTGFGNGGNDYGLSIAIEPDSDIIVAGVFPAYNGDSIKNIARLHADGILDTTFNPGTSSNSSIKTALLQSDGKILICGYFSTFNGQTMHYFGRLNDNGSIDTTFITGTGASDWVSTVVLQNDGKIILGGTFTSINGTVRNRIARVNPNGTLDNTFAPVIGASGQLFATPIQNDGKIIIAGEFTSYDAVPLNRIARLKGEYNVGIEETNVSDLYSVFPNPVTNESMLNIQSNAITGKAEVCIFDVCGKQLLTTEIAAGSINYPVNVNSLSRGIYILQIQFAYNIFNKKFLKL